MGIPVIYRKGGEGAILTSNAIEAATGRGIVNIFLGDANSGANTLVSNNQFKSSVGFIQAPDDVAIDLDFDLEIKTTFTIGGNTIVNMPFALRTTSANNSWSRGIGLAIKKIVGGTETLLASGSELMKDFVNNDVTKSKMFTANFNLPNTILKKGDTLRFTINSPLTAAGSPNERNLFIGIDPADRKVDTQTLSSGSQTVIFLPIRIDL